jgi:hypothetical protein
MIWQYLERMSGTFYNITYSYGNMMRHSADIAGVAQLESSYQDYLASQKQYDFLHKRSDLSICNLSFSYEEANSVQMLQSVNMKIRE